MNSTSPRKNSYGENQKLTLVDRFGIWLSFSKIKKYIPDYSQKTILDLGSGFYASFFKSVETQVEKAYLLDLHLSSDLKSHPKALCREGDLLKSLQNLPNDEVDIVICNSVLEHLENPSEVLKNLYRVLKKGGSAWINVPTWSGKVALEFSAFKLHLSPFEEMEDHKMYYDKRDLWPLLVQAGFKPSKIRMKYHKFNLNLFAIMAK